MSRKTTYHCDRTDEVIGDAMHIRVRRLSVSIESKNVQGTWRTTSVNSIPSVEMQFKSVENLCDFIEERVGGEMERVKRVREEEKRNAAD